VRGYLNALRRGDVGGAGSLTTNGDTSDSSFMTSSAHINSINAKSSPDGTSYTVEADVTSSKGEYFITFTVINTANGFQISNHFAIRV
jgi:hypothetical protein